MHAQDPEELEALREDIEVLFERGDDEGYPLPESPHARLGEVHGLDLSYMGGRSMFWEGSTMHRDTRYCPADEERLHTLSRNSDVPGRLFEAALRLFGDSIVAYHGKARRKGDIRYYPSVLLTFWSGFETFVRYSSELMIITVKGVPEAVERYLRERELFLDKKGAIRTRPRYKSVLDRYAVLLRYGYGFGVDRGNKYWQRVDRARQLRDYYTHLQVADPRPITAQEVLDFMESVMLAIIWPSSALKRSLFLGVHNLYHIWAGLADEVEEYTEQPFFYEWDLREERQFHCNFENVDTLRFPNTKELREREQPSRPEADKAAEGD